MTSLDKNKIVDEINSISKKISNEKGNYNLFYNRGLLKLKALNFHGTLEDFETYNTKNPQGNTAKGFNAISKALPWQ